MELQQFCRLEKKIKYGGFIKTYKNTFEKRILFVFTRQRVKLKIILLVFIVLVHGIYKPNLLKELKIKIVIQK